MSDVMLHGILRMPLEMAMNDKISQYQFYQTAQQALDRMVAAEEEIERLQQICESHIRSEYEGTSLLDGLLAEVYKNDINTQR